MLFFPFCPLSRKEKGIETRRSLRLEQVQRVGGKKFLNSRILHNVLPKKWKQYNAHGSNRIPRLQL
jgi:hypothetical protein